jgi:tetratricopeptide (TPR) repeat protein
MLRRFNDPPDIGRTSAAAYRAALLVLVLAAGACTAPGPVRPDSPNAAVGEGDALATVVPAPAQAAYDRALQAMIDGDLVEAELQLEQFVLEYPAFAGPHVNLAILYAQSGRSDEAEAALGRALAIDPEHPAANNRLGMLLRQQGRFAEAEAAYLNALEVDLEYALAHLNLAILLDLYLHRPSEALTHYRAYQDSLAEPDTTVGLWIIDLQRRLGASDSEARVARGEER